MGVLAPSRMASAWQTTTFAGDRSQPPLAILGVGARLHQRGMIARSPAAGCLKKGHHDNVEVRRGTGLASRSASSGARTALRGLAGLGRPGKRSRTIPGLKEAAGHLATDVLPALPPPGEKNAAENGCGNNDPAVDEQLLQRRLVDLA